MGIGKDRAMGRQFRTLFHLGAIGDLSDGQLLERFSTARGEAAELAFAALVERHGAMVLRVCRGILDDPHDSDDAFQATFLVLVARSRTLWVLDSLGPWLHQVATRTARCSRAGAARRKRLEHSASLEKPTTHSPIEPTDELERVLLEEIDRLPERFRAPVVLCDLEGQTHEAAARALGWPVGTVKSRQARARDRLRDRLTRRGFAPAQSLAILALPRLATSLPIPLVNSTATFAVRFVASRGIASGSAGWIAQEVIRSMSILRFGKIATLLLALGAAGSGAGLLAQGPGEEVQKKPEPKAPVEVPKLEARTDPKPEAAVEKGFFQVKPGKLELTWSESGVLEPSKSLDLLSEVEGATTIISIKPEGTKVTKGETLFELDSALLRDTLLNQRITTQQAEAAYKQSKLVREVAEFAVQEYVDGVLPQERARLKDRVAIAERGLKDGEARLERTRAARKKLDAMFATTKGPSTPSDVVADVTLDALLTEAERSIADHKRNIEMALKDQEILEKFTREKTTRQLNSDVELARSQELRKQAEWQLEQTKVRKLERQIEKCTVKSPGDGILIYARRSANAMNAPVIEEGATVRERQLICRVIDFNNPMLVVVKVPERMIGQIQPGQKVSVHVNALQRQPALSGTVFNIAPISEEGPTTGGGMGGGMGGVPGRNPVYTTRIKLDQGLSQLRPNMSAQAEIVYKELNDVLLIPGECLRMAWFGKKNQVDVKRPDGTIERRDVVLGASNREVFEIKEGLKAGELVVRPPANGGGFQ